MDIQTRREQIAQMIRDALAQPCQARAKVIRLIRSAAPERPRAIPPADKAANS